MRKGGFEPQGLLRWIFVGCTIEMVSSLINTAVVARAGSFGRSDEYRFFVSIGAATPQRVLLDREWVSAAYGRPLTCRRDGPTQTTSHTRQSWYSTGTESRR